MAVFVEAHDWVFFNEKRKKNKIQEGRKRDISIIIDAIALWGQLYPLPHRVIVRVGEGKGGAAAPKGTMTNSHISVYTRPLDATFGHKSDREGHSLRKKVTLGGDLGPKM